MRAFELLDTAKDGKISREEFTAAGEDFLFGMEETDILKLFFGPLLDWIFYVTIIKIITTMHMIITIL